MEQEREETMEHPCLQLLINNPYAPNIGVVSLNFDVKPTDTVLELKLRLAEVYPGKPDANTQRLIHSGKLLSDQSKLLEVFSSESFTQPQHLHMLVPVQPMSQETAQPRDDSSANETRSTSPALQPPASTVDNQRNLLQQQQQWYFQHIRNSSSTLRQGPTVPEVPRDLGFGSIGSMAAFSMSMDSEDVLEAEEDAFFDEAQASEPVMEDVADYDKKIEELKYHYDQLMKAIELSMRVQSMNASMMYPGLMYGWGAYPYHHMMYANGLNPQQYTSSPVNSTGSQPDANQNQMAPDVDAGLRNAENPIPARDINNIAANAPPRQQVYGGRMFAINLRLIFKLALMVYLLNDDVESTRFYVLLAVASLIYLYETGCLEPFIGTRDWQRDFVRRIGILNAFHITSVDQAPASAVGEWYILVKSFFLSLIPSWSVNPNAVNRDLENMFADEMDDGW